MKERFETFTVLIAKISRNIRKIKNREMAEYGLRGAQVSCLYYLYCEKTLIAAELCERCEEDKATISRALEYLEENGYIVSGERGGHRYKSPLSLTEKGEAVGKRIFDKVKAVLSEVSVGLSEEERVAFYRSLAVISEGLERLATDK